MGASRLDIANEGGSSHPKLTFLGGLARWNHSSKFWKLAGGSEAPRKKKELR